jgi:hypothetical protein
MRILPSVPPPFIFRPKEAVKSIYLLTYQILHIISLLYGSRICNSRAKGQVGSTSEVQRTEPF